MRKTLTTLALTVVMLLSFGIVLLASASAVRAQGLFADPHYFIKRQLIWLFFSIVVVCVITRFDYHWWKETPYLTLSFYLIVVAGLLLVFCPGVGGVVKGSYRWLHLGSLRMQPSEFSKILTIIVMSVWLDRINWRVRQFTKGALVPASLLAILVVLLLAEPDFGATLVVLVVGGALMFVAGTRVLYLFFLGGGALAGVGCLLMLNHNRMERIKAWWGNDHDGTIVSSAAYHVEQSLVAFKNGGPWGVGFNQSIQKYNYLPEAHTDFIFAIGGEEFGFIFSIGVVLAYVVILVCGILISMRAPDRFGRLLAFGMTLLLVFQAAFNIGVVTDCLPTKGLALPFISYGGTNLIVSLFAIGTLLNIGRHIDVFDERLHTQVVKNATLKI